MVVQKQRPLRFEQLEDRSLMSANVVRRVERAPAPVPARHDGPASPWPATWPSSTWPCSTPSTPSTGPTSPTPPTSTPRAAPRRRRPPPRRPTTPWSPCTRPAQAIFDAALAEDLAGIPPGRARQGIAIGQEVARQILALRERRRVGHRHDLDAAEQRPGHVPADPAELRPGRQRPRPVHHPVRDREQLPVPPRPAPGPGQPGVRGRLQRGQGGRGVQRRRGRGRPGRQRPAGPDGGPDPGGRAVAGGRWATTRSGTGSPRTRPRPTT